MEPQAVLWIAVVEKVLTWMRLDLGVIPETDSNQSGVMRNIHVAPGS